MFKYGSEVGGINLLYSVLKLIMSPDIAPKMVQYMKRNGGVASRLRGLCIRNTKIHSYFKPTKYGLRLHEKANELWTSESDGSIDTKQYITSESDGNIDTKQYTACPQPTWGLLQQFYYVHDNPWVAPEEFSEQSDSLVYETENNQTHYLQKEFKDAHQCNHIFIKFIKYCCQVWATY